MIELNIATDADVAGIVALLFEMDEHYGDEVLESIDVRTEQTRRWLFGPDVAARAVVAKDGDEIIGLSASSLLWPAVGSTASLFVKELYVRNASRRQGVGTLLLNDAIDHARKLGCSRVEWTALPSSTDAHAFYKSIGASKQDKLVFRIDGDSLASE